MITKYKFSNNLKRKFQKNKIKKKKKVYQEEEFFVTVKKQNA